MTISIVSLNFFGLLYLINTTEQKIVGEIYKIDSDVLKRKIEFRIGEIKESKNTAERQEVFELNLLNQFISNRNKNMSYYSLRTSWEFSKSEFLDLKGNHPIILKFIKYDDS